MSMRTAILLVFIVPGVAGAPLLHAVVPDLPGSGPLTEGFAVNANGADLSEYSITDGEGTWTLPECADVCWFTGNLEAWQTYDGPPATEWNTSKLALANDGDSLSLLNADGDVIDHVAWGDEGDLPTASDGKMFLRYGDGWTTPRIHRIGESNIDQPTFNVERLTLYSSPDSTFQVLFDLMQSAKVRLQLHVHDLTHPPLIDALVAAAERGVDVEVLADGRVPGRSLEEETEEASQWARIRDAGGHVVIVEGGRYNHHHLKVLIADDSVAVQSENWNPTGVPEHPSWGNRGWGVVVHDAAFTDWMADWMADDREAWDAEPLSIAADAPAPHFAPATGSYVPVAPVTMTGTFRVTPVVSPDHTAYPGDPISAAIGQAEVRVWSQQLKMSLTEKSDSGWLEDDRYVAALQSAHGRGVDVQVRLAAPFGYSDTGNTDVASQLSSIGIDAAIWNHGQLGTLHNKGWIIDDTVYVGSMNGHHAARSANREFGVLLEGNGVADWYAELFLSDTAAPLSIPGAPVPILLVALMVARARRTFRC